MTHLKEPSLVDLIARQRLLVLGALTMVLGGMLFTASEALSFGANLVRPEFIYAVSTALVLLGVSLLLFHYLRFTSSRTDAQFHLSRAELHAQMEAIQELHKVLHSLTTQTQITEHASSVWTDDERKTLVASLSESVRATLSAAFLKEVEQHYGTAIRSRAEQSELREICEDSKRRIKREIDALTRRSNINLVIGVITTLLAVGLLAYVVLSDKLISTDASAVLLHFLPRLSIVLFIETFSFFFLRLYKSGLADIKYYQNELTGIEARHVALEAVVGSSTVPEYGQPILAEYARVDRNHVSPQPSVDASPKPGTSIKEFSQLLEKLSKLAGEKGA